MSFNSPPSNTFFTFLCFLLILLFKMSPVRSVPKHKKIVICLAKKTDVLDKLHCSMNHSVVGHTQR